MTDEIPEKVDEDKEIDEEEEEIGKLNVLKVSCVRDCFKFNNTFAINLIYTIN